MHVLMRDDSFYGLTNQPTKKQANDKSKTSVIIAVSSILGK